MNPHLSASDTIPATGAVAVTPSDTTVIATTRALWVGATGNVTVTMSDGKNATFSNVPVGILPVQVTKVLATATTATNITAMY
jgi:hypothetical protein